MTDPIEPDAGASDAMLAEVLAAGPQPTIADLIVAEQARARRLPQEPEEVEGVWIESDTAGTGEAVLIGEAPQPQPGSTLLPYEPEDCDK